MSPFFRPSTLLFSALLVLGCHAQKPAGSASTPAPAAVTGTPVSPELAHRIEVMIRRKAELPPGSTINVSPLQPSDLPGWQTVSVSFSAEGKTSHPIDFLLSTDGKTMAQFNKFDISEDPRKLVSDDGRPSRGGPESASVLIVGYDDLECPFCAQANAVIFPLLVNRYGDKVHFVYKDFPLTEIHPWAMHAAVDVNCMAAQSPAGYWNEVDYIHAHASTLGADPKDPKAEKTQVRANEQLDAVTREQGVFQKVDMAKLNDCLTKQDTKAVTAMREEGTRLGVDATPTLFVNGAKLDGFVSPEFVFSVVDSALRAVGQTPPPPYVAPAPAVPPATPAKAAGSPAGGR